MVRFAAHSGGELLTFAALKNMGIEEKSPHPPSVEPQSTSIPAKKVTSPSATPETQTGQGVGLLPQKGNKPVTAGNSEGKKVTAPPSWDGQRCKYVGSNPIHAGKVGTFKGYVGAGCEVLWDGAVRRDFIDSPHDLSVAG